MEFIKTRRKEIDRIDLKLVKLLETRVRVAGEIQSYKKKNGLKREDLLREKEIISHFKNSKLRAGFIRNFFGLLFSETKR